MSSEAANDKKEYEVGYGKPPKSGQFKKGQSGNKRGSSANRRKARAPFSNPFQEKLGGEVEVLEDCRPVRRTRKHLGVRKLVEAAAKGDLRCLKEMIELQKANDPSPSMDDYYRMGLFESLAWGPPEVLLHKPDTVVIRERDLAEALPRPTAATAAVPKKARKRPLPDGPRDQTWKSLVLFELDRKVSVTDRQTGKSRTMTMREVILEQLANAFANGKKGAMKLAVRINEMVRKQPKKLIPVVYVPHDYVIPPKCDDPRGYPPGHEHHKSWKPFFPIPKASQEGDSEA